MGNSLLHPPHPRRGRSAFGGRRRSRRAHLFEVVPAELHYGHRGELAERAHAQAAVVHLVQVGHHQQQVRAFLDGQETTAWNVDTWRGNTRAGSARGRGGLQLSS